VNGLDAFGPAYRTMLESDPPPPGSVDLAILERMVRLMPETAGELYPDQPPPTPAYRPGSRPRLEEAVARATLDAEDDETRVDGLAALGASLAARAPDEILLGGTEEQILDRATDWCTDLARLVGALAQVAGMPSRPVFAVDTARAYCMHAVVEVHRGGSWGVVDAVTAVVYRQPDGRPASARDLASHPEWIDLHRRGEETPYTTREQFRGVAISSHDVDADARLPSPVVPPNAYTRSILAEGERGWPGGLRWLHGEDGPG
jgi:hypothetical protein